MVFKGKAKELPLWGLLFIGVASEVINELVKRKKKRWRVILRMSMRTGGRGCDTGLALLRGLRIPLLPALGESLSITLDDSRFLLLETFSSIAILAFEDFSDMFIKEFYFILLF